jgi:polyferredoxin
VGVALVVALFVRQDIELTVAPVRNPTFVTLSDGTIRNTYEVRLRNKNSMDSVFNISVRGDVSYYVELEGSAYQSIDVPADSTYLQRVYVLAPKGSAPAENDVTDLRIWVEDLSSGERAYKDTVFNGKANK